MGRPPNPARRVELLEQVVDYVLDHGLGELSLRPLAKALGVSTYTLTYQMGLKDDMVEMVVDHAERRAGETINLVGGMVEGLWDLQQDDDGVAWTRLLLEVAVARSAGRLRAGAGLLEHRLDRARDTAAGDEAKATLVNAITIGLLVDRWLTGDEGRIESALALAGEWLSHDCSAQVGVSHQPFKNE